MTENDNNIYNNGKIYTIRCRTDNNLIYVGSTIQPLHKRFHGHKMKLLNGGYNHRFLYNKMNDLGIDNFYIELYENYNCNSKEELNRREGEVIREIGNLNHTIAGRTKPEREKEYRESNDTREKYLNEKKAYYQKYKSDISKEITCECGCVIQKGDLTRHKKSQKHKYFEEHNEPKPLIGVEGSRELAKQKVTCECGCIITKSELSKHRKTQKHINLMEQKQEQN
jgi:hypothetical protein